MPSAVFVFLADARVASLQLFFSASVFCFYLAVSRRSAFVLVSLWYGLLFIYIYYIFVVVVLVVFVFCIGVASAVLGRDFLSVCLAGFLFFCSIVCVCFCLVIACSALAVVCVVYFPRVLFAGAGGVSLRSFLSVSVGFVSPDCICPCLSIAWPAMFFLPWFVGSFRIGVSSAFHGRGLRRFFPVALLSLPCSRVLRYFHGFRVCFVRWRTSGVTLAVPASVVSYLCSLMYAGLGVVSAVHCCLSFCLSRRCSVWSVRLSLSPLVCSAMFFMVFRACFGRWCRFVRVGSSLPRSFAFHLAVLPAFPLSGPAFAPAVSRPLAMLVVVLCLCSLVLVRRRVGCSSFSLFVVRRRPRSAGL